MSEVTTDAPKNTPKEAPLSAGMRPVDTVQSSLVDGMTFVERHIKLFAVLLVVAILAGLGYVGFQFMERRQERFAQEAYYSVEAQYSKLREGFDRAKFKDLMPETPETSDSIASQPASGDLQKDYGAVIGDLEKVAREHAGTTGGAQAAILAAETYMTYHQPEKAAELAELAATQLDSDHLLAELSRLLWGNALAAKGDCQAAVGVWQRVLDSKSASFLHPEVSLRSGICYENLTQFDKAAEMYRKATADGADTMAGTTAKGLLRALEVKMKQSGTQQG